MIDLHGDPSTFGMNSLGQGAQAGEHLVTMSAEHLRVGFSFGCDIGMAGDDQAYTPTR
jgi:hypothetical protein